MSKHRSQMTVRERRAHDADTLDILAFVTPFTVAAYLITINIIIHM